MEESQRPRPVFHPHTIVECCTDEKFSFFSWDWYEGGESNLERTDLKTRWRVGSWDLPNRFTTLEQAVELALSGGLDHGSKVCVAITVRVGDTERRIIYTGLVRRCRENRPGADDKLVAFVRKNLSLGDISPSSNMIEGLSPRAATAVNYLVGRAYAGIGSRLFGEFPSKEADNRTLLMYDQEVPLPE